MTYEDFERKIQKDIVTNEVLEKYKDPNYGNEKEADDYTSMIQFEKGEKLRYRMLINSVKNESRNIDDNKVYKNCPDH